MADFEEFNKAHQVETYKSILTISLEVLRALILVNGGAAAGMIATLDKLRTVITANALQNAMIFFVLGLIAAVLAGCAGYFTQYSLHETNMQRGTALSVQAYRRAAIALALASLMCFSAGALIAAFGLK